MRWLTLGLGGFLGIACAYLPAPAPDWVSGETAIAKRGVVAIGEAPAAEGIAGADMMAASQLAGALDAWLAPALTPLGPDLAKELYVQVALVASVSDRWVDPADGSHFSRVQLRWEDVDKVIRRALHGDERLDSVLEALPGRMGDGTVFTPRAPDWMQLKWAQVPDEMRQALPLTHVIEAKGDLLAAESKEDKEDGEPDLELGASEPAVGPAVRDEPEAANAKSAPPNPGPKTSKDSPGNASKSSEQKGKAKRPLIKRRSKPTDIGPKAPNKKTPPESDKPPEAKKEN